MKEFKLFDSNCMIGAGPQNAGTSFKNSEELIKSMDYYGINKALVYSAFAKYNYPLGGNETLKQIITNADDRLCEAWVVLPGYTGEFPSGRNLQLLLQENNVKAARLCPKLFSLSLSSWAIDDLLRDLLDLGMPLFLDFEITHWSEKLPWQEIYDTAKRFPELKIILCRIGCGYNRILFPLMDKCQNILFETSYFDAHYGIEGVYERFGSGRMLFGSGSPTYNPSCPESCLYYSELPDDAKQDIFFNNLNKLISGVHYE